MSKPLVGATPTQAVSLDTGLYIISSSEHYGLGPGPPSPPQLLQILDFFRAYIAMNCWKGLVELLRRGSD
nr:hypothetical protein CFP56_14595 [Quercus suber]